MESDEICSLILGDLRPAAGTCAVTTARELIRWPDFDTSSWQYRPTGWAVMAVAGPTEKVEQLAGDVMKLIDADSSLAEIREHFVRAFAGVATVFASIEGLLTGDEWPKTVPLESIIAARRLAAEAKVSILESLEPE